MAKWLSVSLRTKWFWVQVQLQSLQLDSIVKISSSFSSFQNIISGVPQGSLIGPLLFNTFLTDIFLFCLTKIVSYADDNTPYATGDCLEKTFQKVEKVSNTLFK